MLITKGLFKKMSYFWHFSDSLCDIFHFKDVFKALRQGWATLHRSRATLEAKLSMGASVSTIWT